ncbi:MAG: glycosyltransferase [Patescibacteria group bacterium]
MKIALVHDYLIDFGGAERVLVELHKLYPNAPIYVSIYRKNNLGKFGQELSNTKIIQSWFGYLPFADKLISPLRFLLPLVWKSFNFSNYDLVITSASWAVTKGLAHGKTTEICYLHTPPRYLYGYDTSRNWKGKWFSGLVNMYALIVNHFMRQYDFNQAQKVNYFIANCKNVGKRIEKFYRRYDYQIVYPPIDLEKFKNREPDNLAEKDYYLTGGRMVAAKNFDLIIKACKKLDLKLKIFGDGPSRSHLEGIGDKKIEFLGQIGDEQLVDLYRNALGFIVAQKDEDFGITPLEAAAAGCPTITFKGGGYLETVIDGKTGIFFSELSVESLTQTLRTFGAVKWNQKILLEHARKFSTENFKKQMAIFVNSVTK